MRPTAREIRRDNDRTPDPPLMPPAVIENPILNSPFEVPRRHFCSNETGTITGAIAEGRRPSNYFVPVAQPRLKAGRSAQPSLFPVEPKQNDDINHIRARVHLWRERDYPGVTATTRLLLRHWQDPNRERKLFFCQVEALETLIYLTEAVDKNGDRAILDKLKRHAADAETTLLRMACKMATGSGKTAVMGMVIAWHLLNLGANPADRRFSESFLVVTPGITIRDRLRVLLPGDPENCYRQLDLVPGDRFSQLGAAKIVITNYHAFKCRDFGDAGGLTKKILAAGKPNPFLETPGQMARRVCRDLGTRRQIVVLNDEAHHCYRPRPATEKLTGDDRKEAEERQEEARLWISGLEAVYEKIGVKTVYDLSATPFYLKGSGYPEGRLFPWVVSDFSLIDAIESGIVKVPRVPVAENALGGDSPTFRELWLRIRDQLPKKRAGKADAGGKPALPKELAGALHSLYAHYEKTFRAWEADPDARAMGRTPPVFIVVCNNTAVSKLVFDWIAGHDTGTQHPDGTPLVGNGELALFSNADHNRRLTRPNTILVDSRQLESGEGMSDDLKKLLAPEIAQFEADYRRRYPGRDSSNLTETDLLREVMNTVGKPGKLGEGIRCVVSVSMLTEGWDVNSVTHVLGVRAFGTQLLCEQVIGRALRRRSYTLNDEQHFDPEYAEVYGVPFDFLPCANSTPEPREPPGLKPGRICADPLRAAKFPYVVIEFPRVTGYRFEPPPTRLEVDFTDESRFTLTTEKVPTRTDNAPIVGEVAVHTLTHLEQMRKQTVCFGIARILLEKYYRDDDTDQGRSLHVWLFPQLVSIVSRWMTRCLTCLDNVYPGLLLLDGYSHLVAEKIHRAIVSARPAESRVHAIPDRDNPTGSTTAVSFDTRRPTYGTLEHKCHIPRAVLDSKWEGHLADTFHHMPEVASYVKNHSLFFKIPYSHEGRSHDYYPDYLVRVDDGHGPDDLLTLVVEVSGQTLEQKTAKVDTANRLWIPAVNALGTHGRWGFVEIDDPFRATSTIRDYLRERGAPHH